MGALGPLSGRLGERLECFWKAFPKASPGPGLEVPKSTEPAKIATVFAGILARDLSKVGFWVFNGSTGAEPAKIATIFVGILT